jgi:hypothetical protein
MEGRRFNEQGKQHTGRSATETPCTKMQIRSATVLIAVQFLPILEWRAHDGIHSSPSAGGQEESCTFVIKKNRGCLLPCDGKSESNAAHLSTRSYLKMMTPKSAYRSPTLTPPSPMTDRKRDHETSDTEEFVNKRRKNTRSAAVEEKVVKEEVVVEEKENGKLEIHQDVLLLHAPKQPYALTRKQSIPEVKDDREMLVKIQAIGLNPIDWKAP